MCNLQCHLHRTLQISIAQLFFICMSAFGQDIPPLIGQWPEGPSHAITIEGSNAYVGSGATVKILNISDASALTLVANVYTPAFVNDLALSGGILVVANGYAGFTIVDCSNLTEPQVLGTFEVSGDEVVAVELVNGFLYVLEQLNGLSVFDLSNAANPQLMDTYDSGFWLYKDVQVIGGNAFIAHHWDGLHILDVSDPTNLNKISPYNDWDVDCINVINEVAYIGDGSTLRLIDVSDASNPFEIGSNTSWFTHGSIVKIFVQNNIAYCISDEDIFLIDVSDGNDPTDIVTMDLEGYLQSLQVQNSRAYISSANEGIQVVEYSENTLSLLGAYATAGSSISIQLEDNLIYVANGDGKLRVFDATFPSSLTEIASLPFDNAVIDLEVVGDYLYLVLYTEGLKIIDISNPAQPFEVFSHNIYYASNVHASGNHLYVGARGGIYGWNVSNPSSPSLELGINYSGPQVLENNNYCYLGGDTLHVYNVASFSNPILVSTYIPSGIISSLFVYGNALYLGCTDGLRIIDITYPTELSEISYFEITDGVISVEVEGDRAFLAKGDYGLGVLDVSNTALPFEMVQYDTWGYVADVSIGQNYTGIANGSIGIYLLDNDIVGVHKDINILNEFELIDAYPNPFNPSTTIKYGLPVDSNVSLVIYDVRGQVVQTLESGHQSAGWYDVVWNGETADGKTISTGIYFARLVAGDYSQVIKMLYLK